MNTKDLLFEIGTEELPTKAVKTLSTALAELIGKELQVEKISYKDIRTFATPKRLAVLIKNLNVKQPDFINEKRGPALTAAYDNENIFTKAAIGFAKSCNTSPDKLEVIETDKGGYLVFKEKIKGQKTEDLLEKIINNTIKKLPIPKPMRWGNHEYSFARPIHWLLLLFGNKSIKFNILGIQTSNCTYGHRFLAPEKIYIKSPEEYEKALKKAKVIANFEDRLNNIKNQVIELAKSKNLQPVLKDDLLEEVTSLVEWPVALLGSFDKKFLNVPQECLITSMVVNQKYFALTNKSQKLQPYFIFISNIKSTNPTQVINGNERVLSARLADAEFFYNSDKSIRLDSRIPDLANITYQQQLGTLLEKTTRIEKLAVYISDILHVQNRDINKSALIKSAQLSKTDLTTKMVYEFPELQGIMGKYYALNDLEDKLVAETIEEYYKPKFAGDSLPQSIEACILAIADKIDTITSIFAINQKPTGEKDPFGLRRAALGVLRILIEQKLPIDLKDIISKAIDNLKTKDNLKISDEKSIIINKECLDFCFERLKKYYLDRNISINLYYSVLNSTTSPYDFDQRILAVNNFLSLPESSNLIAANKRVKNILKQHSNTLPLSIDANFLTEPSEISLNKILAEKSDKLAPLFANNDYNNILNILAKLQSPIDDFFDNVMVMADDPKVKNNRLLLLFQIQSLFNKIADISELQ